MGACPELAEGVSPLSFSISPKSGGQRGLREFVPWYSLIFTAGIMKVNYRYLIPLSPFSSIHKEKGAVCNLGGSPRPPEGNLGSLHFPVKTCNIGRRGDPLWSPFFS